MKLAFFSCILNNHQAPLADELCRLLGDDYVFVETENLFGDDKKGSVEDYSKRQYLLRAWDNLENRKRAFLIAETFDVCIFDGAFNYLVKRMKTGKLTFQFSERWFKGIRNVFSPWAWGKLTVYHFLHWKKKPLYKLCAGAFVKHDENLMRAFIDKCYKFGYFIKSSDDESRNIVTDGIIRIMWCSRFIDWKHPELAIKLADYLNNQAYKFRLDMFGSGPLLSEMQDMVSSMYLDEIVKFRGNLPNDKLQAEMKKSDIFIFTSDSKEGWGAVANEAMANGCCIVGSDKIGSIPYLVKDGYNGSIFKSGSEESFFENVQFLMDNPEIRIQMAERAKEGMKVVWSPDNAAKSLIQLINDLVAGNDTSIEYGPCSKA